MERIKRVLFHVFRNIYHYRVDYIRTFLFLRLFQLIILAPAGSLLIWSVLKVIGVLSITEQNIVYVLQHPYVWFVGFFAILVLMIFIYYETGMLMLLAYHQQKSIPYTLTGLWRRLNKKVMYFFSFQTLILLFYIVLIIPLISVVLPISLLQDLQIPKFIVDELKGSTKGLLLYVGVLAIILAVSMRFIFTLPFFAIYETATIWEAVKKSWQFSHRRLHETLGMLAFILIVHVTISTAVIALIFIPLFVIERVIPGWALVTAAFTLTVFEGAAIVLFTLLQAFFSQILVLVAFQLTRMHPVVPVCPRFRTTIMHWTVVTMTFLFFLVSGFNTINLQKTLYEPETKIIAHRGFMERGVENTLSSIRASKEAGAHMVEIDIQQTADGEFVLFHDATLARLAGRDNSVENMTLEELLQVEVSSRGLTDTIPSLEQALVLAKELNIRYLIELKPHGKETDDWLERLLAELASHGVLDIHYIQALDAKLIAKVNELEPRVRAGEVYAVNFGSVPNKGADFIAIEQFFVGQGLVDQAKELDMPILVWTVNTERDMQKFLEMKVDGIITNHPDVLAQLLANFDDDRYFMNRLFNKIQYIF